MAAIKDLDFVFSEAGFDCDTYRSFPLALQSRAEQAALEAASDVPQVTPSAHARRVSGAGADTASRNAASVTESPSTQHRPPVLSGLLSPSHDGAHAGAAVFGRTITVMGAAGGVGTTTIAVTLARLASRRGGNVFLLDAAEESIVPLYLGAGRVISGVSAGWSFLPHPESRQGVISVVACGDAVAAADEHSPWNRARHLGGASHDTVIDSGSHRHLDCSPETVHNTASLVVLSPDIRSVLQVRHIERKFAGRDANSLPLYLLNQFHSEIPLHQEVRASLSNHLGKRLAPMTVRGAREIPQALSEGLTVLDFAPDSPVASDIVQVAEWLRRSATFDAQPKQSAAVAGL